MALIPPDAGLGMRMQTGTDLLQPLAPVKEIPADLPELRQGRVFSAHIQEVLPENTYKALVAGKQITLQLPSGANAGDTLELVVIDRTPKVVIAQLAAPEAGAAANEPYPYATLSKTGQMIGNLLAPEGAPAKPTPLNRGEPLLPQPPTRGAELAPALQKAVVQSGLFYESHQAQWLTGRMPLQQLLQEPQGQHSMPATLIENGLVPTLARRGTASPANTTAAAGENPSVPKTIFGGENRAEATSAQQQAPTLAQVVPEELRPIVQQQLDAMATQRLLWHGEAWPGQPLEWEIVREDERGAAQTPDEAAAWQTTLRLDTPRLGHIDAALKLSAAGLQLTLRASAGIAAEDLQAALPALTAALEAAGIPLLAAQVRHESE